MIITENNIVVEKNVANVSTLPLSNEEPLNDETFANNKKEVSSDSKEDKEDDFLGIYFIQLITGEKFIAQLFSDENSPFYVCFQPLRIIELISDDDSMIRFNTFNPFIEDSFIEIHCEHIIYKGIINEETAEVYLEYVKNLDDEEDTKKTKKSSPIIKKDENVVFGNFITKPSSFTKKKEEE